MSAKRDKSHLLARVNFPLYTVKAVGERHILVAGGGGMAKTGISNALEIYELIYEKSIDACRAVRVAHFDTGSFICCKCFILMLFLGNRAIMSSAVFNEDNNFVLAAGGIDGMCIAYKMKYSVNGFDNESRRRSSGSIDIKDGGEGLRRRRLSSNSSVKDDKENDVNVLNRPLKKNLDSQSRLGDDEYPNIGFVINKMRSIQSDFNNREGEEPFVKVIRFSNASKMLVTGGADGHIRCWKYPEFKKILDIAAHSDEVDDIDIHPEGNTILSVSRDGHGYVWNAKTGSKICELEYVLPISRNSVKPIKYNFRSIRYGIVEGDSSNLRIFTILNPVVRQKPPNPSYLCKWNTKKYIIEKTVSVGPEVLSAMTISDDGRFLGVGTLSGTIYVYISYSLQRLYRMPKAHNIFITGVEFLKSSRETQNLTGDKDASLISISVDNHIVVHHIPKQGTIYNLQFDSEFNMQNLILATLGFLGSGLMFTITLLVVYILLDLLGL
ncbi:prolactin regulatory element-binding protein-like protein [Leptotrombidium deliense]|uniref:Prolactin regulatory element-binding protein-like protein n=1 Tax=Leptotrombidium deliense TaxID=299467 RepID=A0A443SQU9_9ACAR|nr:prolactin regulatory element-binding protein-like protein [Leptotrombidium deliense]